MYKYLQIIIKQMIYADIIDELISSGKEIEAVYFASESGLTERFPPINLLKSYHRNYKKNVTTTSKKGNSNHATTVCLCYRWNGVCLRWIGFLILSFHCSGWFKHFRVEFH